MHSILVAATHNANKTREIREIAGSWFDDVLDLNAWPEIPPAVEAGATFEENSAIKALHASVLLPEAFVLADDSGLEVDSLGGAPGVISARYAGPDATDAKNRKKLLAELDKLGSNPGPRTARFRCVLTVAKGGAKLAVFSGSCEGRIVPEERGQGGFGYDALFIPEGFDQTFGELSSAVKNQLSHRAAALRQFVAWIQVSKSES